MKPRRILTDAAGYLLLLAAVLTGWLPGPGGIPLVLAGLGLLSIHNAWARRLRQALTTRGSSLVRFVFVDHPLLQAVYDTIVVALLIIVAALAWQHGEIWQVSLGTILFFIAIGIGLANRRRYERIMRRIKRKQE